MVVTDELTGVTDRERFMQQLETESRRHQRSASPICVLICDVDHFKQVNNTQAMDQEENGDGEKAVQPVDNNLYLAKQQGRNQVVSGPGRITAQACPV